jgi:hypothetical protein
MKQEVKWMERCEEFLYKGQDGSGLDLNPNPYGSDLFNIKKTVSLSNFVFKNGQICRCYILHTASVNSCW